VAVGIFVVVVMGPALVTSNGTPQKLQVVALASFFILHAGQNFPSSGDIASPWNIAQSSVGIIIIILLLIMSKNNILTLQ
jgi:hypothetical protein